MNVFCSDGEFCWNLSQQRQNALLTNSAFCCIILRQARCAILSKKDGNTMYPDTLFLGLTLYDIFILVGVVAAFLLADRMTVKSGFSVTLQKIVIVCALSCVIGGYGSAVLFQAFYNIKEEGKFVINSGTGATFYGGLIGGAAAFLLIYFRHSLSYLTSQLFLLLCLLNCFYLQFAYIIRSCFKNFCHLIRTIFFNY